MSDPIKIPKSRSGGVGQYNLRTRTATPPPQANPAPGRPRNAFPRTTTIHVAGGNADVDVPRRNLAQGPGAAHILGGDAVTVQGGAPVQVQDYVMARPPVPQMPQPAGIPPTQTTVDMRGDRHPLIQAVISRLAPVATAAAQTVMPRPSPQMPAMNISPSEAIARDPRASSHIPVGDAPPDQAPPTSVPVPAYAQGGPIVAGPNRDESWNRQAPPQSPLEQWQHAIITAVQNGTISIGDAQRLMSTQRVPD